MNNDGLTMNQLAEKNAEYVTQIAKLNERVSLLTEQRDALVAENAVLIDLARKFADRADDYKGSLMGFSVFESFNELKSAGSKEVTDAAIAALRAEAFNDLCKAFVLHKQSACLDDTDKVSVREATDALLHCAEQLASQLRESKGAQS